MVNSEDTPSGASGSFENVSDLDEFRRKREAQGSGELDIETLDDVTFAHYKLASWAHISAKNHIVQQIIGDITKGDEEASPSKRRLRALMIDERFEGEPIHPDPYKEHFDDIILLAKTDNQLQALKAVQRLHAITLSSELSSGTLDPHIRQLVVAIVDDQERHTSD